MNLLIITSSGNIQSPDPQSLFEGKVFSTRETILIDQISFLKLGLFVWSKRDFSKIVLINSDRKYLSLFCPFWRLLDKKIWFWTCSTKGNFLTRLICWMSDRVFYSNTDSFLVHDKSAEFIDLTKSKEDLSGFIIEKINHSSSKLRLFSPTFLRYVLSGLLVVGVNLTTLTILTEKIGLWYLYSSIVSFFTAFVVSFLIQKTWTYRDREWRVWSWQFGVYFIVSLINLTINTIILYLLVDLIGLSYIIAQSLTVGLLSLFLFFVYGRVIFRPKLNLHF